MAILAPNLDLGLLEPSGNYNLAVKITILVPNPVSVHYAGRPRAKRWPKSIFFSPVDGLPARF